MAAAPSFSGCERSCQAAHRLVQLLCGRGSEEYRELAFALLQSSSATIADNSLTPSSYTTDSSKLAHHFRCRPRLHARIYRHPRRGTFTTRRQLLSSVNHHATRMSVARSIIQCTCVRLGALRQEQDMAHSSRRRDRKTARHAAKQQVRPERRK